MLPGARKLLTAFCLLLLVSNASAAERPGLVLQVNDNDPRIWSRALKFAESALKNSEQPMDVTVVVFGPGIHMLSSVSKVANQLYTATHDGVKFLVCGKTMKKLKMKDDELYYSKQIKRVDGGIFEIMLLQNAGWTYIKP
jgi:intracellular sulfur oxidation DsrE/DsrF family protein